MKSVESTRPVDRGKRVRRRVTAVTALMALSLGSVAGCAPDKSSDPAFRTPDTSTSAPIYPEMTPRNTPSSSPTQERTEVQHDNFVWASTPIDDNLKEKMRYTLDPECPTSVEDLTHLSVSYWGFDGKQHQGELVVHNDVSTDIVSVMNKLYDAKFPIEKMVLPDVYEGDDDRSMEANNTSGFNCRKIPETDIWAEHAFGRAIDINPQLNPEVFSDGSFDPSNAGEYLNRSKDLPGMIKPDDVVVQAFESIGWSWGGYWNGGHKDYQHFSQSGN
ncbi:MAG TPA: M15 family metallopeptidase [Patescibacteria group bacterium]|nr:M15 family metallopeptidase [Patescibacteria group bacterium]